MLEPVLTDCGHQSWTQRGDFFFKLQPGGLHKKHNISDENRKTSKPFLVMYFHSCIYLNQCVSGEVPLLEGDERC